MYKIREFDEAGDYLWVTVLCPLSYFEEWVLDYVRCTQLPDVNLDNYIVRYPAPHQWDNLDRLTIKLMNRKRKILDGIYE